jgi:hypothetical protein
MIAMIIAIVLVSVLVVVLLATLLLRRSVGRRVQQSVSAIAMSNAESGTDRPKAGQVRQVAEAYNRGEIDAKTIRTAAKVLGISADEASRRLESAADKDTPLSAAANTAKGAVTAKQRDARRKKNKQSKKSRQGNRR